MKNFLVIEEDERCFNPEYLKAPNCSSWNIKYHDQEIEAVSFSEAAKKYADLNENDNLIFKPKIVWIKCKETQEVRKVRIELTTAYKITRLGAYD